MTNDDGVDSPALMPLARAMARIAPVRIVVPEGERSWIGKAISRWSEVRVERVERDGFAIARVGGLPADCVNLAVHSLFGETPVLVVSGVNLGLNTALGLFLSSGTIGAAMEAWIAGIPALAFSAGLQGRDREWKAHAAHPKMRATWDRAAGLAESVTRTVWELGLPTGADLLSVNFPIGADSGTERVVTDLAPLGYEALFRRRDDGCYVHEFSGVLRDEEGLDPGTDVEVVRSGRVSITPVRLPHTVALDDRMRAALEARGSAPTMRSPLVAKRANDRDRD